MTEESSHPPPHEPVPPAKTPERLRQEELFLWPWRILLAGAALWAGVYAWIGVTWPIQDLERLAAETIHGTLQLGVTVFLGAELAYYAFISWSFRRFREWGMAVWAIGLLAVVLNLRFAL